MGKPCTKTLIDLGASPEAASAVWNAIQECPKEPWNANNVAIVRRAFYAARRLDHGEVVTPALALDALHFFDADKIADQLTSPVNVALRADLEANTIGEATREWLDNAAQDDATEWQKANPVSEESRAHAARVINAAEAAGGVIGNIDDAPADDPVMEFATLAKARADRRRKIHERIRQIELSVFVGKNRTKGGVVALLTAIVAELRFAAAVSEDPEFQYAAYERYREAAAAKEAMSAMNRSARAEAKKATAAARTAQALEAIAKHMGESIAIVREESIPDDSE